MPPRTSFPEMISSDRLGDKGVTAGHQAGGVPLGHHCGVAGDQRDISAAGPDGFCKDQPVHPGHHDIGDHQTNRRSRRTGLLQPRKRLVFIRGADDLHTSLLKQQPENCAMVFGLLNNDNEKPAVQRQTVDAPHRRNFNAVQRLEAFSTGCSAVKTSPVPAGDRDLWVLVNHGTSRREFPRKSHTVCNDWSVWP